jgi:coenzyme F420 hydrogenase subunit beta
MNGIDTNLSIAFTDKDLCTRCGTCVGICPEKALEFNATFFPSLIPGKCTECGLCAKVCPGGQVSFKDLSEITFGHRRDSTGFDGHVSHTFFGHAAKVAMRDRGSGGGVVTALLWDLLKRKKVDGCIVTRMNRSKPWTGDCFIARNHDDLFNSQGSRYTIIPVNAIFQEIKKLPGTYAYVALPCQIHGYRMAAELDPDLKKKISVAIGLFCGGSLEPIVVSEMLKTKGLMPGDIRDFEFRGGAWPGRFRAILKSGETFNLHYSNYKDGAYNYLVSAYMPKRCQTCIDGSNEFSDLSIGDAWTKDTSGDYKFKAHSRILIRTSIGLDLYRSASQNKTLISRDVSGDASYQTHQQQTKRKGRTAPIRIERLKRAGKNVPQYDRSFTVPSTTEIYTERIISSILWLCRYKNVRFPLIKFLTSRYAIPLIKVRMRLKKLKYR